MRDSCRALSRDQHFFARIAARFETGANHQQTGELTLRAGDGLEADGFHAGDFESAFLQIAEDSQAALRKLDGLIGMLGGEAVEPRDEFIDARIVFHGAGAQRVHAEVDGVSSRWRAA